MKKLNFSLLIYNVSKIRNSVRHFYILNEKTKFPRGQNPFRWLLLDSTSREQQGRTETSVHWRKSNKKYLCQEY